MTSRERAELEAELNELQMILEDSLPSSSRDAKASKRTVFSTGEIPHLWMHKAKPEARNAQGNLYFNGDTIYSYGSHFPIARHVTVGKRSGILFTIRSYSNTTAGHISAVSCAITPRGGVTLLNAASKANSHGTWNAAFATTQAVR